MSEGLCLHPQQQLRVGFVDRESGKWADARPRSAMELKRTWIGRRISLVMAVGLFVLALSVILVLSQNQFAGLYNPSSQVPILEFQSKTTETQLLQHLNVSSHADCRDDVSTEAFDFSSHAGFRNASAGRFKFGTDSGFRNASFVGFAIDAKIPGAARPVTWLSAVNTSAMAPAPISSVSAAKKGKGTRPKSGAKVLQSQCDIYDGYWVYDASYPLYSSRSCPFIDEGFNCEANLRPHLDFMKWRWQPNHCDLPRFNATTMLELLRGKRLVFVGDSMNRNQWESMLCLLSEAVPDKRRVYEIHGRRISKGKGVYSFVFKDYRCTVEFYVTHFLVQEGKGKIGNRRKTTLRLDKIDRYSSRWKGADILIFNTAHWWTHNKVSNGRNYFQEGDQVYPYLDVRAAFKKALITWASWLNSHVDARKTSVFFRSYSPSHFRGGQWNTGGGCHRETQPFLNDTLTNQYNMYSQVVLDVLANMTTPVTLLNITRMTFFRKDGHPSVFGRRPVGASNVALSSKKYIQDCSHWCLPGVPDSWNELLYALILSKGKIFKKS